MVRQLTAPVNFQKSTRRHKRSLITSGRAGKVAYMADIMLLPGDAAGGAVEMEFKLAEMPRPLLNRVFLNAQAWFVPWSAMPKFSGMDEFNAALTETPIKQLGEPDRSPPNLFDIWQSSADRDLIRNSEMARTLGKHFPSTGIALNSTAIDAFWMVHNFRLAAHSDRLPRALYAVEDLAAAVTLPRAFWPSSRITRMVPDYDRELLLGAMDMDVEAGQLPVEGIRRNFAGIPGTGDLNFVERPDIDGIEIKDTPTGAGLPAQGIEFDLSADGFTRNIFAEMTGQPIRMTLADLDMARSTQAFAKMHEAMAGMDGSGYTNEDMIIAMLMSGLNVPKDQFKRPWVLSSSRVPFVLNERHALDGASLDQSVTLGGARVRLPVNVPRTETGGYIVVIAEVLPDRIDEGAVDETWLLTNRQQLPDALRDVQRVEPVDPVLNRRIDARHQAHSEQYAWEGMNDVWNVEHVHMGGDFYNPTAGSVNSASRQALWVPQLVNPSFTENHYLCPDDFPHDVFSLTTGDAYEASVMHDVSIVGLTQIGNPLQEHNGSFEFVENARNYGG